MLPVADGICEAAPPSNTTRNTTEKLQPCNCRIKSCTAVANAQKSIKISLPSPTAISTADHFLLALRKHHHLSVQEPAVKAFNQVKSNFIFKTVLLLSIFDK